MTHAYARRSSTTAILAPGTARRATAPATTITCANDAEVLDRLLGALDSREFVFRRLMGLADTLGCMLLLSWSISDQLLHRDHAQVGQPRRRRTCGKQNPTGMAKTKTVMVTEHTENPPSSPPDGNNNALFVAVTNLNAHMTRCASTAHGAAPVLGAQRPALNDHARCATSRVPNCPG